MRDPLDDLALIAAHDRYPRLDLVNADLVEHASYRDLLVVGEHDSRRLFPVAQGGVVEFDLVTPHRAVDGQLPYHGVLLHARPPSGGVDVQYTRATSHMGIGAGLTTSKV